MTRYYHATPRENLDSIMQHGILRRFGEVYCSTNEETAARWICFTRRGCKEVITLPFNRRENDERMNIGADHSPLTLKAIGAQEEGASFTSSETIPPEDIDWSNVIVYQNPFYSEEAERVMNDALKHNQQMLMEAGAEAIKNDIIGDEEE